MKMLAGLGHSQGGLAGVEFYLGYFSHITPYPQ